MLKQLSSVILLMAAPVLAQTNAELKEQVRNTERAFANARLREVYATSHPRALG